MSVFERNKTHSALDGNNPVSGLIKKSPWINRKLVACLCLAFLASSHWVYGSAIAAISIYSPNLAGAAETSKETVKAEAKGVSDLFESLKFDSLLVNALYKKDPNANFTVSPVNLRVSLALLGTGAQGETRKELESVLGVDPADGFKSIGKAYQEIADSKGADNNHLSASVGLFVEQSAGLQKAFISDATNNFGAKVETLDFKRDSAKSFINAWFENMTQGKVSQLIEKLPRDTQFVIGSALNFKANWVRPFDKSATKLKTFNGTKGVQQVEMMATRGKFEFLETSQLQIALLPFQGSEYAMVFCMPKEGRSLSNSLSLMIDSPADNPQGGCLTGGMPYESGDIKVELPKFDLNSKSDMKAILSNLGLKTALSNKADYRSALAKPVVIDQIAHQVNFKVDEVGAEVAAATAVVVSSRSADISKPRTMSFDRPFLAILVQTSNLKPVAYGLVNHF